MDTTYREPRIVTELPGPKAKEILELDRTYVSPSYTRDYPLVADTGRGCWVEDVDGNLFLDMAAGIATCSTGHCHPRVVDALRHQASKLIHMSGTDFYYRQQVDLAHRLSDMIDGGTWRVFFGNSGAEAVEAAFKLARWHTRRPNVIAFVGAFHGRTMGALSLTASKPVHRERFDPFVPGVHHVEFGDAEAIERLLVGSVPPSSLAAVFVEPIQGEGGYNVAPTGFLGELRAICDRTGALLVVDEVQSGMGRTGRLFAYEHDEVLPDVICAAKGIASGMPLGACIARGDVMDWVPGTHASTFGGNPLSCRAAAVTLDLLQDGLIENAARMGARLHEALSDAARRHKGIVEVRGRGLMLAVEVQTPELRNEVIQQAFRRGLLLLGCGEKAIRFSPPLVVVEDEAELAVNLFREALRSAG